MHAARNEKLEASCHASVSYAEPTARPFSFLNS